VISSSGSGWQGKAAPGPRRPRPAARAAARRLQTLAAAAARAPILTAFPPIPPPNPTPPPPSGIFFPFTWFVCVFLVICAQRAARGPKDLLAVRRAAVASSIAMLFYVVGVLKWGRGLGWVGVGLRLAGGRRGPSRDTPPQ
jgi:hypothetical protein